MRFKKAYSFLLALLLISSIFSLTPYTLSPIKKVYAADDPIDDCLTYLGDKINSTFAEGNYTDGRTWNITWTGSDCYFIGEVISDGFVYNASGVYHGSTTDALLKVNRAYTAGAIYTSWLEFDTTPIQQNNINVTNVDVWAWLWSSDSVQRQRNLTYQPSVSSNETIWNNARNGSLFWEGNPQIVCGGFSRWCEMNLNSIAWSEMQASLNASVNWWALSLTDYAGGSAWDYWYSDNHTDNVIPYIEIYYESVFVASPCGAAGVDLLDGVAGEYMIANDKFYTLKGYWENVINLTAQDFGLAFTDGVKWINITWDSETDKYYTDESDKLFVKISSIGGNFYRYNETTLDLFVLFVIFLKDDVLDHGLVDVYQICDDAIGYELDEDGEDVFKIYSSGGMVSSSIVNNASFTAGGDWFEMCAWSIGQASAAQTWYKLQSFNTQYALRIYENLSGVWTPEDQFFQTQQHAGGGEKWASLHDWDVWFLLWGWDNVTSQYVRLSQIQMYMVDGDEGAADEWVAIQTFLTDRVGNVKNDTWNAFIEEEPAARYRTWLDMWVDNQNASSVIGQRTNAYYFGMNSGGYMMWSSWNPMIYNGTEAIGYVDILNGNNEITNAQEYGMMKLEIKLQFIGDTTTNSAGSVYRICLEDINIKEVKTQSIGQLLTGVSIPIYNSPKVPDMAIAGILSPLYAMFSSLGDLISKTVSGAAGLVWATIDKQFPFLTNGMLSIYDMLTSLGALLFVVGDNFANFISFLVGQIGFITIFSDMIIDSYAFMLGWLNPFLSEGGNWLTLFLIIFIIVPFAAKANDGDLAGMESDVRKLGGILQSFLNLTLNLLNTAINFILGLIPF